MPETDYPAAHSMDTEWFAVDADGFVAILSTGEDGPLPIDWERFRVSNNGYDAGELIMDVEKCLGKKAPDDEDGNVHSEALGFFRYDHSLYYEGQPEETSEYMDSIPPYERAAVPDTPLHISSLPAEITKKASLIEFKNLRFQAAEKLQPIGTMECISWGKYEYYLDENMQPHPFDGSRCIDVADLPNNFAQPDGRVPPQGLSTETANQLKAIIKAFQPEAKKPGQAQTGERTPDQDRPWWKRLFGID